MKLSLAVALNLALLATAAPTALKRDSAEPNADVTSKIATDSLKSVDQMMDMYNADTKNSKSDSSSSMDSDDVDIDKNGNSNFPGMGMGNGNTEDETANNLPINMTPNSESHFPGVDGKPSVTEGEKNGGGEAMPSPSPSPSSAAGGMKMETGASPSPSPTPSPSASTKPKSMLENIPLVGGVAGKLPVLGGM